ncbi:MAG: hypothetical protein E7640_03170 [Ruminococcaceae bacterium]|nr:hypothetical protein [Oscillospiraceae bacterium]
MDQNNTPSVEIQETRPTVKKYKKYDIFVLLACLIIALGIWVYVMNTSQDPIEKTITVEVDVSKQISDATGMTIFSNLDDSFEGSEMDYSKLRVELTVMGTKNVLDKYSAADYQVTVDTSEIKRAAVQRLSFLYSMPSPDITFKSITTALPVDLLYIDKPATATLTKVSAELKSPAASGTNITLTPMVPALNISGPEKTINSITGAAIVVDLSGIVTSSIVSSYDIRIYGADGNEIKSSYVNIDPSGVTVDVMLETERRFPITFKQTTAIDEEYTYTAALAGDVSEIVLYGDTALMNFDNFVIDLGDITKLTAGSVKVSDLVIPKGLVLGEGMEDLTISYVVKKDPVGSEISKP